MRQAALPFAVSVTNRVLAAGDLKAGNGGNLTFGHPSGTFSLRAEPVPAASPNDITFTQLAFPRTARIICHGHVYIKNQRPQEDTAWKRWTRSPRGRGISKATR